jgi:hypothetical protein
MTYYLSIFFFLILLSSCNVTEENIVGTYYLKESPKTRLVLKKDKTFMFVKNFSKPGIEVFPDSIDRNFRTTGNWQLNKKQLVINSFQNKSLGPNLDVVSCCSKGLKHNFSQLLGCL